MEGGRQKDVHQVHLLVEKSLYKDVLDRLKREKRTPLSGFIRSLLKDYVAGLSMKETGGLEQELKHLSKEDRARFTERLLAENLTEEVLWRMTVSSIIEGSLTHASGKLTLSDEALVRRLAILSVPSKQALRSVSSESKIPSPDKKKDFEQEFRSWSPEQQKMYVYKTDRDVPLEWRDIRSFLYPHRNPNRDDRPPLTWTTPGRDGTQTLKHVYSYFWWDVRKEYPKDTRNWQAFEMENYLLMCVNYFLEREGYTGTYKYDKDVLWDDVVRYDEQLAQEEPAPRFIKEMLDREEERLTAV